jgi:hypothetical protein
LKELGGKFRIKISSSEIIDGILDEGHVKLEKRHLVLKELANIENKQWKDVKKKLLGASLVDLEHVERMWELLKVRGSISMIEEQLKRMKSLRK